MLAIFKHWHVLNLAGPEYSCIYGTPEFIYFSLYRSLPLYSIQPDESIILPLTLQLICVKISPSPFSNWNSVWISPPCHAWYMLYLNLFLSTLIIILAEECKANSYAVFLIPLLFLFLRFKHCYQHFALVVSDIHFSSVYITFQVIR